MRPNAEVIFRRLPSGEVIGDVKNEKGEVIATRSFGIMTEGDFHQTLRRIGKDHPDIGRTPNDSIGSRSWSAEATNQELSSRRQ